MARCRQGRGLWHGDIRYQIKIFRSAYSEENAPGRGLRLNKSAYPSVQ